MTTTKPQTARRQTRTALERAALSSLTQSAAAWLIGVTPRHLRDRAAPQTSEGSYDGRELVRWYFARELAKLAKPRSDDGDSAAIRLREARAASAELELAVRRGQLVDREQVRDSLSLCASILRDMGQAIQREFGDEGHRIVSEALTRFDRAIRERFLALEREKRASHTAGNGRSIR